MTDDERRANLKRANEARTRLKEIKAGLKAGEILIDELLEHPPPEVRKLPIAKVMGFCPGLGSRAGTQGKALTRVLDGVIMDGSLQTQLVPFPARRLLGFRARPYQIGRTGR